MSSRANRRVGRYELLAQIASGGMGSVLLARLGGAGGFERCFALKVMHPHLMGNPEFVGMLLEEARLAAQIHHPNVVSTIDVGQHLNFHYVVMDYVEGFPLTRVLEGTLFSARERVRIVCRVLLDALSGLSAAHTLRAPSGALRGIVHRDVSPQNILVGVDGVGRLTDFGIAVATSRLATQVGTLKGKPSYLAPEQARGEPVDQRTDLWALGVILWEALTGRRLFVAETEVTTLEQVLSAPIPRPGAHQGPTALLEHLCMRALERDPRLRPATAREMFTELERAASQAGLLADAHEISDLLGERLGAEIAERRRAQERYGASTSAALLDATLSDIQALPRLNEGALSASSSGAPIASPVGALTLPAARFLRTPLGTTSEVLHERPRRGRGAVALLGLFALGSLTTLGLLQFRILDESSTVTSNGAALAPVQELWARSAGATLAGPSRAVLQEGTPGRNAPSDSREAAPRPVSAGRAGAALTALTKRARPRPAESPPLAEGTPETATSVALLGEPAPTARKRKKKARPSEGFGERIPSGENPYR